MQAACADRRDAPPAAAKLLPRLQGFENIPRNQKKFCNWVKNSLNLRGGDAAAVDALEPRSRGATIARAEARPRQPPPAPGAVARGAGREEEEEEEASARPS